MVSLRSMFSTKAVKELSNYDIATPNRRQSNMPLGMVSNYFRFGMITPPLTADPIYRPLTSYAQFVEPKFSFAEMEKVYTEDAEVGFGLDWLTAVSVGMGHHFTAAEEYRNLVDYVTEFSYDLNLDEVATIAGRESLGFGNSLWTYKDVSIKERSFDIIEPLPLTALKRLWWNGPGPNATVGRYEFRGAQVVNMLPAELIHFRWRIVNAWPFGLGLIAPIIARPTYKLNRNGVDEERTRMSLSDIKNSFLDTAHKAAKRYVPRNVYNAEQANAQQLTNMQSKLDILDDEQDVVLSGKNTITELGKQTRAIDLESFKDLYRNEMIKAVATPASKLYETGSLTEASSKVAKEVALMHMNGFQRQMQRMFELMIIKPWYMANPKHDANGVVIPWKHAKLQLHWGMAEKPKMEAEIFVSLAASRPQAFSDEEIREYASSGGVTLKPDTWIKPLQIPGQFPMQQPGQQEQKKGGFPNGK